MKIYTITLNPAYDIHAYTSHFEPFHENFASVLSREAGGKGVNISRALSACGAKNTALIVLGRDNSGDFKSELKKLKLNCIYFEKEGRIRENLTLHTSDSDETRISFSGFSLDDGILNDIAEKIDADSDTVVTFTGSVPKGMSIDAIIKFLDSLKEKGAKVVIDSRSFTLDDLRRARPWLIKPNQEEISAYFASDIANADDAAEKAIVLADYGIENVMISLGSLGALLVSNKTLYSATPPKIEAISTIGAGDSSIAGFIAAYSEGCSAPECLCRAIAFGSAACLSEGSQPPRKQDVEKILCDVRLDSRP